MRSDLFDETAEIPTASAVALQNPKLLKCALGAPVLARQGAMVAFQGGVRFDHEGAGLARFVKQWATGESLPLMRCTGQGEVFFADRARDIAVLHLDGDGVTVNSANILAFDSALHWDIKMVQSLAGAGAQGLFTVVVSGTGWVALTTTGTPLALDVRPGSQTFADADAAVAWSTGLRTSVTASVSFGELIGRGSGELWKMRFEGAGFVVVQPSEERPPARAEQGPGAGGTFGAF